MVVGETHHFRKPPFLGRKKKPDYKSTIGDLRLSSYHFDSIGFFSVDPIRCT